MTSVLEALKSAQFVVDAKGQCVAVQLNFMLWEALLAWLENEDSLPTIEELTQKSAIALSEDARSEDRALVNAGAQLSEPSLASVWDNPEDDIYNDI